MPALKLDIDNTFSKTLDDLRDGNVDAKTQADVIQRAVATYKYFRDLPPGQKIQVVDSQGNVVDHDLKVP